MPTYKSKPIPALSPEKLALFQGQIARSTSDACWPWTGSKDTKGYGRFFTSKVTRCIIKAHRLAYFLHYGIDPGEMRVCHKCDNPPCCNPFHFFLGTDADNIKDCLTKGHIRVVGVDNSKAELTPEQVLEIRTKYAGGNVLQRELAIRYRISRHTISNIVTRRTWKHLPMASPALVDSRVPSQGSEEVPEGRQDPH